MALAKKSLVSRVPLGRQLGDGEHDREVRLDDLAGWLEPGRERTKYHRSIVAGPGCRGPQS